MNSFDELAVAIALVGPDLCYRFANSAYAGLLGYVPNDLVGNEARQDVYPGHVAIYEEEAQRLLHGVPHAFQMALVTRGGRTKEFLIQTLPLLRPDHSFAGALGVVRSAPAGGRKADEQDTLRLANLALAYTQALQRQLSSQSSFDSPADVPSGGQPASLREVLSPRQGEVLSHLIRGLPTERIALLMSVSPHTIRNHTRAIYRKLGVSSRVQLIAQFWNSRPR